MMALAFDYLTKQTKNQRSRFYPEMNVDKYKKEIKTKCIHDLIK